MMTISELKERKNDLGYTNEDVAERSGVPLSTVQKILCGATKNPRRDTMEALEMVLKKPERVYEDYRNGEPVVVREGAAEYFAESSQAGKAPGRIIAVKVDCWTGLEPSEKWPRQGEYTIADIEALPDDTRVELIDGFVYDLAAPDDTHQFLVPEIYTEFRKCIEENEKRCIAFVAPFDVILDGDDRTCVQPDVLVMCERTDENDDRNKEVPDLIAEVLSDSTRVKDCTIKLRKYMNAGVKEYWIVDPKNEKVLTYIFGESLLPRTYSFNDKIPVGISGGECIVDFGHIMARFREVGTWNIPGVHFV